MSLLIGKKDGFIGKKDGVSISTFISQLAMHCLMLMLCMSGSQILFAMVTSEVNRSQIDWNETIQLTIETDQSVKTPPRFRELEKDFEILGQSQSQNYSIINGDARSSVQWHLELAPKTTGTLTIPAIEINGEYTSVITIEVKDPNAQSQSSSAQTQKPKSIYLTAAVDQIEPFVQSQVLLTLELYYINEATEGTLSELKLDHAIIERLGDKKTFIKEINHHRYHVVQVQFAIFPQQTGAFTIPEILFEGSTAMRKDAFFNNFSGFSQKRVREKTNSITLMVKEIPNLYPKNKHWVSATSLEGEEILIPSATSYQLGDSITRKVILKATDQLSANLPTQFLKFETDQAKIYPDNAKNTQSFDGQRLVSVHEESIVIMPSKGGRLILPAIEIPWWNTKKNQLMFFHVPERQIQIKGAMNQPDKETRTNTASHTANTDAENGAIFSSNNLPKKSVEKDQLRDEPYQLNTLSWILIILFCIVFFILVFLFYRLPKEIRKNLFKINQDSKTRQLSNAASNAKTIAETQKSAPQKSTTKILKKNVISSFYQKDPVLAKQAILEYARDIYQMKDLSFQLLLEKMEHDPLKASLKQLEKALYAKEIDWQGDEALLAFEDWNEKILQQQKKTAKKLSDDFSSLYPTE